MSDQYDYVKSRIEDVQEEKLNRLLSGNVKTIEILEFERGYLKAMQDVEQFGRDYITSKTPKPQDDEEEI